jgi:hypothetical protein
MRDPNDPAHPLCLGVEARVPHQAPNEGRDFILSDTGYNDAITRMPQVRIIETCVTRAERGVALSTQQNDNLFVLQALATNVEANLFCAQPPCQEQQALSIQDVLVQDDHVCARSKTYSGAVYWSE